MAEAISGGETKIAAARRVMAGLIDALPDNDPALNVGFRVFGHRGDNTDAQRTLSCQSTELLAPIQGVDKPALQAAAVAFEPTGWTPISLALQRAGEDMRAGPTVRNRIIMVTDGQETCDGDPCAVAQALRASAAEVHIDVVGFGTTPDDDRALQCIAENSGGTFANAVDAQQLANALRSFLLPVVALPQVALPTVELPTPELPQVTLPTVELPQVTLPTVELPGSTPAPRATP